MSVRREFDMCCPKCGEDDRLDITARVDVRLTENGSDADASENGDHIWDATSAAHCCHCGWTGIVVDCEAAVVAKVSPDSAYIAAARALIDKSHQEVEDGADVIREPGGAWVQAWLWVDTHLAAKTIEGMTEVSK